MIHNPYSLLLRSICLTVVFLILATSLKAQAPDFSGKRIGIYFSSREFQYPEDYYLPIAQFLTIEEDRSYTGKMKNELLIRLGDNLSRQFGTVSGADSVYFLNADLEKGRAFIDAYDPLKNRIFKPAERFPETDYFLILNKLDLDVRLETSFFIRSNRMLTERVRVKTARMTMSLFDQAQPDQPQLFQTCFDERRSPKVPTDFDFYNKNSPLGKFFSQLFAVFWIQIQENENSNCDTQKGE